MHRVRMPGPSFFCSTLAFGLRSVTNRSLAGVAWWPPSNVSELRLNVVFAGLSLATTIISVLSGVFRASDAGCSQ